MPTAVMSPLRANSAWVRRSLCACRSNSKTVVKSTGPPMARQPHILVVDDEHSIRLMLESGLSLNGFRVSFSRNGAEALAAAPTQEFDAVISDNSMPDGDGLTLVQDLRALFPALSIILITGQGSVELAVRAVEEGATDFIAKPFEVSAVAALLRRYLSAASEAADTGSDISTLVAGISRSGLVGKSPAMVGVYRLIARAARRDAPVLVVGEPATGKELVARAIHDFSPREKKSFVTVNCSGLTDTLLEAELFGDTKGAFTGLVGGLYGSFR